VHIPENLKKSREITGEKTCSMALANACYHPKIRKPWKLLRTGLTLDRAARIAATSNCSATVIINKLVSIISGSRRSRGIGTGSPQPTVRLGRRIG
jgi:hypothetical protein